MHPHNLRLLTGGLGDDVDLDESLAEILGDSAAYDRQVARDDKVREVLSEQSGTDISDLFEGVDDDFLEALSSAEPLGAIDDDDDRRARGAAIFEGPDWVEDLRPDEQIKLQAGGLELEFDQRALTSLPDHVRQLRDETITYVQNAPEHVEAEPIEEGTLAGISGGLAPLNTTDVAHDVVLATGINVSEGQAQRIEVLDSALAVVRKELMADADSDEVTDEQPEGRRRRRRRKRKPRRGARTKPDRLLIALALLAAIIVPFLDESFHFGEDPDTTELTIEQASVLAGVNSLESGDRVLVVFDYGPTAAGELNPLAEAVLRDVLSQGAVPLAISTNPLGLLNGRYVLNNLATDNNLLDVLERDRLVAGSDYYLLRYISGGAVGIRSLSRSDTFATLIFSTDSTGDETNLDIGRLDSEDVALVLVIGETTDDVRNWAEQFDIENLPKFALVTTAIEPVARAYVDSDGRSGFYGYLAGYRDTYRYNVLRNDVLRESVEQDENLPDIEIAQWHSIALGALVAAGIILFGNLINLLRSVRRRRS